MTINQIKREFQREVKKLIKHYGVQVVNKKGLSLKEFEDVISHNLTFIAIETLRNDNEKTTKKKVKKTKKV